MASSVRVSSVEAESTLNRRKNRFQHILAGESLVSDKPLPIGCCPDLPRSGDRMTELTNY